jgi:hypothetical protein
MRVGGEGLRRGGKGLEGVRRGEVCGVGLQGAEG